MSFLKYDQPQRQCTCKDCGRTFVYGTEADNEEYCLRCERELELVDRATPASDDMWVDDYRDEGE